MRVRVTVTMDTETGDYEAGFKNLSDPGKAMDLTLLNAMLSKIFPQVFRKAEGAGQA